VDVTHGAPSRLGPFVWHYLEMVLAMAAGMAVYGMLFRGNVLSRDLADEALMGAFMTVPMVAWMRYRGHSWRQGAEMAVAMLAPAFAVFAAGAGQPAVSDRALMLASHAAMLLGMLALMLARRADYAHPGTHHPASGAAGGSPTHAGGAP
jgi:hypothetical protein